MEDEQIVEKNIRQRRDDSNHQRGQRASDAIEEAEHAPDGHAKKRAADTRKPEFARKVLDLRLEPERPQDPMSGRSNSNKQRRGDEGRPQADPDRLGSSRIT